MSSFEVYRNTEDRFTVGKVSDTGDTEILKRRTAETAQVIVFRRPDREPVIEVTRAV